MKCIFGGWRRVTSGPSAAAGKRLSDSLSRIVLQLGSSSLETSLQARTPYWHPYLSAEQHSVNFRNVEINDGEDEDQHPALYMVTPHRLRRHCYHRRLTGQFVTSE